MICTCMEGYFYLKVGLERAMDPIPIQVHLKTSRSGSPNAQDHWGFHPKSSKTSPAKGIQHDAGTWLEAEAPDR
jgi:hypothetical protein